MCGRQTRHSFSSRLLYTVVPSELYVTHRTLDTLLASLVADYCNLYNTGLKAPYERKLHALYMFICMIGVLYMAVWTKTFSIDLDMLQVVWGSKSYVFRFIPVVCKGDWPWLRSAMHLSTGFSSLRKCHLCDGQVHIPALVRILYLVVGMLYRLDIYSMTDLKTPIRTGSTLAPILRHGSCRQISTHQIRSSSSGAHYEICQVLIVHLLHGQIQHTHTALRGGARTSVRVPLFCLCTLESLGLDP